MPEKSKGEGFELLFGQCPIDTVFQKGFPQMMISIIDIIKVYPCVPSCVVFIKFPQEVSKRHHIFCSVRDVLPNGNVEDVSLEFAIVNCKGDLTIPKRINFWKSSKRPLTSEECVTSQDDRVIAR